MFTDGVAQRLWQQVAPGSEDWDFEEQCAEGGMVRNISVPMITPALPAAPTDRAVIVLPGGAMHFLSYESEGTMVSEFIREAGIAAFLLKYRVVPTPQPLSIFRRSAIARRPLRAHRSSSPPRSMIPLGLTGRSTASRRGAALVDRLNFTSTNRARTASECGRLDCLSTNGRRRSWRGIAPIRHD